MRKILILAGLLIAGAASAEVLWRGDFETGDLSQFTTKQMVNPDRIQVIAGDVREGNFAMRVQVNQGDNPIGASGNRNELTYQSNEKEGDDRYYKWSTKFDESYPSDPAWQLFAQWHHSGCCGSPPIQFVVKGENMQLEVGPQQGVNGAQVVWQAPIGRGKWHDFVFHAKWSSDPAIGFVELWVDGDLVVPKTNAQTLFPGEGVYLKSGLYRAAQIGPTGIVYHDGWMMATTLEDVMPSKSAPASSPPVASAPNAPGGNAANTTRAPLDGKAGASGCGASTTDVAGLPPMVSLAGLAFFKRRKKQQQ